MIDAFQKSGAAHYSIYAGGGASEILEQSQLMGRWKPQELHVPCSFSGQVWMEMGDF